MTSALVPLADGVEEIEAVVILDTLRRAGWHVTAAGVAGTTVAGSRGVRLLADALWDEIRPDRFDALVLPGGAAGTETLAGDPRVLEAVRDFARDGKIVGAVCAGPLVLDAAGVLQGRRATCHPAVRDKIRDAVLCDERVVVDGLLVTGQGPGAAIEFALALVGIVDGRERADNLARAMIV